MSDEEYTIEVYALYHCDPGNSPLSIAEFNEIVGCNIPENEKVENHMRKLRAQFGPNEVIPHVFGVPDLTKIRNTIEAAKALAKKAGKLAKKGAKLVKKGAKKAGKFAKKGVEGAKKGLGKAKDAAQKALAKRKKRKAAEEQLKKLQNAKGLKGTNQEALDEKELDKLIAAQQKIIEDNKLHDEYEETAMDYSSMEETAMDYSSTEETAEESSFSLEDALLESEYEDLCDKCDGPKEACDHEFEDQVEAMSIEDAQTLQHLVAFKSKCSNIEDRVMKGKGRYMEALKSYMNGDTDQEIRMFNGKKVKISSLKPSIQSLKEMFSTFPQGPHIIDCV